MSLPAGNFLVLWGHLNPEPIENAGEAMSLTYEESVPNDKGVRDNQATITWARAPAGAADLPFCQPGAELSISWGRGGRFTEPVQLIVDEPEMEYGDGVKLIVRTRDKGAELKGLVRQKVHEGLTFADVVKPMMADWGLTVEIDTAIVTGTAAPFLFFDPVQRNESDWRYIVRNCHQLGVRFWVDSNVARFRLDAAGAPFVRHVWRGGEGVLKRVLFTTKRQKQKAAQQEVNTIGHDEETGQPIIGRATPVNDPNQKLSPGYVDVDANTYRVRDVVGASVPVNAGTQAEADALAQGLRQDMIRGQQVAELDLPGIPFYRAGLFMEIQGVAQRYSGLWRLAKVIHTINDTGYSLKVTCDRETTGAADGAQQKELPASKVRQGEAAQDESVFVKPDTYAVGR